MPTSSFTEQLIARARQIQVDDFILPTNPFSDGDELLGQMTHFHCQLFALWQNLAREAEIALAVVRHPRNQKEYDETFPKWTHLNLHADLVGGIFWFEITQFFGCGDKFLTIRSRGEIVTHFSFSPEQIVYIPLSMRDEDSDDF